MDEIINTVEEVLGINQEVTPEVVEAPAEAETAPEQEATPVVEEVVETPVEAVVDETHCLVCNGAGRIAPEVSCETCNGTGLAN